MHDKSSEMRGLLRLLIGFPRTEITVLGIAFSLSGLCVLSSALLVHMYAEMMITDRVGTLRFNVDAWHLYTVSSSDLQKVRTWQ